jgi:hypothetical protein
MENAKRLRRIGEAGIGIVLASTPLLLWIAWTPTIVVGVMATAVLCAALLVLLTESSRDQGGKARRALPPEFVAEVHELFPLTYHHSRHETPRFRRTMNRLSRLMESSGPADPARR